MSEVKTNKISPATGTAITLGDSGDVFSYGSGAGGLGGIASVQTFTSSGTWTKPTGVTKVMVEVQGAGGSGSGSPNTEDCQGGSGGGYAKKLLDVSSISSATITIGTGGAGVAGLTVNAGNAGGASSWADGTNTITGNGGGGGVLTHDTPTEGATATGGDVNIQGGDGGSRGHGWEFLGGDSFLGTGGYWKAQTRTLVARPPRGYGSGSGGSHQHSGTSYNSEDGAPGIIIVWEYK